MKKYNIVVMPGDGIGTEVIKQAIKVLNLIGKKFDIDFNFTEKLIGGIAIDNTGEPLPQDTVNACLESDAVLLGAVGGYKWDNLPGNKRPEAGLLAIRKKMDLFANIRPARIWSALKDASPLKEGIIGRKFDLVVVRELTGGIYFGNRGRCEVDGDSAAFDTMIYSKNEVKRITEVAFNIAQKRSGKLTSVDKANVLENSRLWRETVEEVAKAYADVSLNHLYVDNAAMQLVINPSQFDVLVTGNMFGDILSDEASMITGSIGMLPSASIGSGTLGLYEPVHGSAPDIAGQDKANPLATILSTAMMLRYSLNEQEAADCIENAVEKVLEEGYRTGDIKATNEDILVGCCEMGDLVCKMMG